MHAKKEVLARVCVCALRHEVGPSVPIYSSKMDVKVVLFNGIHVDCGEKAPTFVRVLYMVDGFV